MKRYRILTFQLNPSRDIFRNQPDANILKHTYGEFNFDEKFKRFMALDIPVLSIVEEHSQLLEDIHHTYVLGYFYPALTGACCLGERIFNNIIFRIVDDFKLSPRYKKVHNKGSINDWEEAIDILKEWGIIDQELGEKYSDLGRLRNESVHYQNKDQDAEKMSLEAINLVNFIISRLFGIDEHHKDTLLYFDVPGEIFIRKDAEEKPIMKAFYIPCSVLVGPQHEVGCDVVSRKFTVSDDHTYQNKEVTDQEFVRLRNNKYSGKQK